MRTSTKLALLSAAAMLAGVGAFAQPAPSDAASPQSPTQGHARLGRPDPEAHQKMLLEKYDANKDGKLDDAEFTAIGKDFAEGKIGPRPSQGQRGQEGFNGPNLQRPEGGGEPGVGGPHNRKGFEPSPDARGPQGRQFTQRGQRNPEDFAGGPENSHGPRNRDGIKGGPGFAPGQRAGVRPNMPLQGEQLEAFKKQLLEKYDANKDGKLSDKERTAIGKDIEEGKLPPPPHPLRPLAGNDRPQPPFEQ